MGKRDKTLPSRESKRARVFPKVSPSGLDSRQGLRGERDMRGWSGTRAPRSFAAYLRLNIFAGFYVFLGKSVYENGLVIL